MVERAWIIRIGSLLVVLGLAWALLAGCGAGGAAPRTPTLPPTSPPKPTPTATPAPTSTPTPKPTATPTPTPEIPPEDMEIIRAVQEAIARLAEQYSQEHPGNFRSERIKYRYFSGRPEKAVGKATVEVFFGILEGLGEKEAANKLREMLLSPDSKAQIIVVAYFGKPIAPKLIHGRPYGTDYQPIQVKVIAQANKYGTEFEVVEFYGDESARTYLDLLQKYPFSGPVALMGGHSVDDPNDFYAPFWVGAWVREGSAEEFLGLFAGEADPRFINRNYYKLKLRGFWVGTEANLVDKNSFQLEQLMP